MIRRAIKAMFLLIGLAMALVLYFALPVGRYTLYEHSLRIAATEPARELGRDLEATLRGTRKRSQGVIGWQSPITEPP